MRLGNLLKVAAIMALAAVVAFAAFSRVPNVPWLPLTQDINLGLDLQGGVHVVLEAVDTEERRATPDAVKRAMGMLEERIDQFGVTEPVLQQQGLTRIVVEIAGVDDPDQVVRDLIRPADLIFKTDDGETVLTGADLADAREAFHPQTGEPVVNLTWNPEGARTFGEVTTAHEGRHLAIYLDEDLLQNPRIDEPILNGKAFIRGYESLEEAHRIAVLLRSGALPVKLNVMEKRMVGPWLGADSLARSVNAGMIGFGAILAFMVAYYRLPGFVAAFSLTVYGILVLLILAAFNATLTLAGIFGFLLSLGIAIDANIIIFERLKEELRTGRSLRSAVDAGFKRALVTILDANVTTLIAAAILYALLPIWIKGFALTLGIGILTSMFTGLVLTRWVLQLVAGSGIANSPRLYRA
ncbi:MAG: protein translocase subunit SecD [Candidatus Desulforudis sp.]|nr:protein translocase subunit SecD [Desulforudis sp.]